MYIQEMIHKIGCKQEEFLNMLTESKAKGGLELKFEKVNNTFYVFDKLTLISTWKKGKLIYIRKNNN
jgi:hypothetical protein